MKIDISKITAAAQAELGALGMEKIIFGLQLEHVQEENKQLREENEQLRVENEQLKQPQEASA
ncbi:hypothetical protein [Paenisporosarcina sp. OV554]|uniref:hypothetical protein n=1 Tax=Paenisporosarcina sp. OV554 TaxID=2135694 RepID=UPI000D367938|nr:hypothetical protein [Paenisporosarcina sp. OV554]PUB12631.1 hypothetical protein C8K15_109130 [Paenisporosarcina sp. OV554]